MKLKLRDYKFNKKIITSCILIVALLCIGVGYSYLQSTLAIDGDVTFDVCFSNNHRTTILGQTVTYYDDDKCSEFVSGSTGINFFQAPSDTNGKGVYLRAGTENDENPIYYYRGNVDNNHVLFGGYCWDIIRTTEQGGVKLIYDGEPNNGQCNNTGTASHLGSTSVFNENNNSLADVGYMYGERYEYISWMDLVPVEDSFIYGSDVTYSGGVYTLIDPSAPDMVAGVKTKHYTCMQNSSITCNTVYYVYSLYDGKVNAIALTGEKNIEEVINKFAENKNDSTIKIAIDNWFRDNLLSQQSKLEDAVWCNDRSISSGGFITNSNLISSSTTILNPYYRVLNLNAPAVKNIEACPNQNDRFTMDDIVIGNGALTYPVGLITVDESKLAGYATSSYLNIGSDYFTLSPALASYEGFQSWGYIVGANGGRFTRPTNNVGGVRPSIVLKKGIVATSGDGTSTNPYVVN